MKIKRRPKVKTNILITAIGSSNSITFLRGLRKEKKAVFSIIGTDIYERYLSAGAQFCDKFFRVPPCKNKIFISSLLDICRKNAIDVLVPMLDEEMLLICRRREDFLAIGTRILLASEKVIDTCLNKINLYNFLTRNNFPTPVIYGRSEVPRVFPVIRKPVLGRGSHDITFISGMAEFKKIKRESAYLIQEYIEGREFSVDTISNLKGTALAAIPRLRLDIKDGKSVKAQTIHNKIIEGSAKKICDTLKMTGLACLQCRMGPDNIPYFFDVNPRIGSASILTIEAGVNIPLLAVKNILGKDIDNACGRFKEDIVMLRYWDNIFTRSKGHGL